MKTLLYIDCCVRGEASRTQKVAQSLLQSINDSYKVIHLKLTDMGLKPLINEDFKERESLLASNDFSHPRFDLAHQLAQADAIVMAAPFWDLSFPSLLKIYIENCAVDRITFKSTEQGLKGLCKANNLVYLTTRGGFYTDNPSEQALPYIKHMADFFGIDNFHAIAADGMDVYGFDSEGSLNDAITKAATLGEQLFG